MFSNNFGLRSLNRQRQLRLQLHKIISAPPSQHWWSVSFILTFSLSLCIVSITFRIFQWEIDWSHYTGWLIDRSTGTCILIVLKLCLRLVQPVPLQLEAIWKYPHWTQSFRRLSAWSYHLKLLILIELYIMKFQFIPQGKFYFLEGCCLLWH